MREGEKDHSMTRFVKEKRMGHGRHAPVKTVTTPAGHAFNAISVALASALTASPFVFVSSPAFATQPQASVTSARSFRPGSLVEPMRTGGREASRDGARQEVPSVSTSVPMDTKWGGIEKLDIKPVRSPAEQTAADGLTAAISAASPVYDAADGRLTAADSHLRAELKTQIDSGNSMLGNLSAFADDLKKQADAVGHASDAVTATLQGYAAAAASSGSSAKAAGVNSAAIADEYNKWLQSHPDADLGAKVLQYAMTFNGYPYVWGASGPDSFDCSGLVMYAYAHFGIRLPHFSGAQAAMGVEVPPSDMRPGDVLANSEHAALYYGKINGEDYVFNAANPSDGVRLTPLRWAFSSSYHIRRMG